jgi:GT2 family glycosyltransferase
MTTPRVLVTILNWRQPTVTVECVRAVQAMNGPRVEILLIDNGSADDSVACLTAALPDIELIALLHNVGFAAGANYGLRRAIAEGFDYALLLNNDACPAPDMLTQLLAQAAPDVALLSPKIYYETMPSHLWFAGGRQHRWLLEMRDTGEGQADGPLWNETREVDYLLGTGLLVNVRAVQAAGLLDEAFFMYYEDLDWCIRLRQAGYRLRLVVGAKLYHRVAFSSGGVDSPLQRYHLARSSILFFRRHAQLGWWPAILLFRLLSAAKMVGRLTLTGQWPTAVAYLRGWRDGWRLAK